MIDFFQITVLDISIVIIFELTIFRWIKGTWWSYVREDKIVWACTRIRNRFENIDCIGIASTIGAMMSIIGNILGIFLLLIAWLLSIRWLNGRLWWWCTVVASPCPLITFRLIWGWSPRLWRWCQSFTIIMKISISIPFLHFLLPTYFLLFIITIRTVRFTVTYQFFGYTNILISTFEWTLDCEFGTLLLIRAIRTFHNLITLNCTSWTWSVSTSEWLWISRMSSASGGSCRNDI